MSHQHIYLICSLPMLHFGAKAPFSFGRFLAMCEGLVSEEDLKVFESLNRGPLPAGERARGVNIQPALQKWQAFDTTLRNELAKIRASRRHIDPAKYLRNDGFAEPSIVNIAASAHRNPSPLAAEKMLDEARWRFLDELSAGHYFDIDILIIYALKLLILERWERINTADRLQVLEETLNTKL